MAEDPVMTSAQMLRALDYVEAVWFLDETAMDRLEQRGEPIRFLLANVLDLLVTSVSVAVSEAETGLPEGHTALATALTTGVREWAQSAQPEALGRGDSEPAAYRAASMGIARTVGRFLLEAVGGEPGDLTGRLQHFRTAWTDRA
ncbi:hypothetical protein [Streptomyces sp. NPDC088775]|uniref:hypothetical protein n=1 Tax=Streptomyces sp. NPDC088775 TaxID=3365896 RepID=UPI003800CF11